MSDPSLNKESKRPCGFYRTTLALGDKIPAGILVFYHNHGEPGPGLYLPQRWHRNQAIFHRHGIIIPDASYADSLELLPPEGFYRVVEGFYCCEEKCRFFKPHLLVQLGYNRRAEPIIFLPKLYQGEIYLPERGSQVHREKLDNLCQVTVELSEEPPEEQGEEEDDDDAPARRGELN
jgi:hypothetical protein